MKDIHSYCQGESHKATDKPCQDCAYSKSSATLSMAIVSDGHGGERYFRSQIGSQIVVDVIKGAVKKFTENLSKATLTKNFGKPLFDDMPFVQYPCNQGQVFTSAQERQNKYIHEAFMTLFSSIIGQWNMQIAADSKRDLTEWELNHVPKEFQDEFNAKRKDPAATLEKTYGCTFMAYVQTKTYWFAFHLGDGKCVKFDMIDGKPTFTQPIPWDEKCFLNKTTSICGSDPLSDIRYCYCGDGTFPEAIFLGSDGIDDSFGDGENLTNFYIQLYQTLATKGVPKTKEELKTSLPIISQKGSKDDMSVACVYNENNLKKNNAILVQYQLSKIEEKCSEINDRIEKLFCDIENFYSKNKLSEKEKISLHYAECDWRKAVEVEAQLYKKMSKLGVEKDAPKRNLPTKENISDSKPEASNINIETQATTIENTDDTTIICNQSEKSTQDEVEMIAENTVPLEIIEPTPNVEVTECVESIEDENKLQEKESQLSFDFDDAATNTEQKK